MGTGQKSPMILLVIICLAISIYNLYTGITLKEEIAGLKGQTEASADPSAAEDGVGAPDQKTSPAVTRPAASQRKARRIVSSAKARVEDRYVSGRTVLPEGQFTEEGTVVIEVWIDDIGTVTKTVVASSTIEDEEVQYACREAALKTDFSINHDQGHDIKQKGTITYTFTAQ